VGLSFVVLTAPLQLRTVSGSTAVKLTKWERVLVNIVCAGTSERLGGSSTGRTVRENVRDADGAPSENANVMSVLPVMFGN
jgi:hypothetical protein